MANKFRALAGGSILAAAALALVGQQSVFAVVTDMNTTLADVFTVADTEEPAPATADAAPGLDQLIAALTVVDELPTVPGYDRDCGKGNGCVFGPSWTDNYTGPDSHNGCDTRNDILRTQLIDVRYKPNTHDCKVISGTLNDPYTGTTIAFSTEKPSAVQVDHVYPLSRGWRAGAATWTPEQRVAFANDTASNLIASEGKANQAKSDQGPDTWLPPNTAFRCEYAQKYLVVAAKYHLVVTAGDVDVARRECNR
ncbi:HNH endonuclease family protein [Rhodococcus sp. NM-2]|uniref:HNH endonuclease family protein n=1 Tax=Rhodococcus sp. NM-2 TaxID=3401174 RepID=UPI003AAF1CF4